MAMNPEIKAEWLTALRDGSYKQGKSRLRTDPNNGDSEYCCFGVLCDIIAKRGLGKWGHDDGRDANPGPVFLYKDDPDGKGPVALYAPDDMLTDIGFSSDKQISMVGMGGTVHHQASRAFADMNDNGMPFTAIADVIEKEIP